MKNEKNDKIIFLIKKRNAKSLENTDLLKNVSSKKLKPKEWRFFPSFRRPNLT
jgi:hypothetical protein